MHFGALKMYELQQFVALLECAQGKNSWEEGILAIVKDGARDEILERIGRGRRGEEE